MFIPYVLFSLLIVLIAFARIPRPVANKQGKTINSTSLISRNELIEKSTFTIATFNIQTGKSLQGNRDISRAAKAIKDVDLIGIQEVYAPGYLSLLGISTSQIGVLAKTGNFDWLLSATLSRWFREHRGNLLLSKLPISDWKIQALSNQSGKNFRNMSVAKVMWNGQTFHFINTHLHTRGDGRDNQVEFVLAEFSKYPRAILVGDFNCRPTTPKVIELLENKNIIDILGTMKVDPDESNRVDWILTKGFKIHNAKMIEKGISDHPYYEATVSFNE